MRRRKFEITGDIGIAVHSREPRVYYSVIDKRSWPARLIGFPGRTLFTGSNPAECYEWIERYRQTEKTAAEFRG